MEPDTEHRDRMAARLREQEERLRRILAETGAAYFRIGLDGRFEEVNDAWLKMHKMSAKEEILGHHYAEVQVPQGLEEAHRVVRSILSGRRVQTGESARLCRDGTIGYHTFSANPVVAGGQIVGLEGFLIDTTERREAEEARRLVEERYRGLFNAMAEGVALHVWLYSESGEPADYVLLDVNPAFETILSLKKEDVVGRTGRQAYGTPTSPYLEEFARALKSGKPYSFETYFAPMKKHFAISVVPFGTEHFATIFFDVTERKRAEEALRVSETTLASLFHSSPDSIVVTTPEGGVILDVNDTLLRTTGYRRDEVIGRSTLELGLWMDLEQRTHMLEELDRTGLCTGFEAVFRAKDGRPIPALISSRLIEIRGAPCYLSTVRDITDRKRAEQERSRLEEQLREAQKLESIGRLAGGIAHDFNNLLTVINGYGDLMMAQLDKRDPLRESLVQIRNAGERAAGLTQQLLAFSRRQIIAAKPLNLNGLVEDMHDMLQRLLGEDVELVIRLDPALGLVMADTGQMHQVLMNLVVNARDAMPGGGTLLIETGNIDLDEAYSARHQGVEPGPYVMLAVTDTGIGMDAETQGRIFEPFFTTKPSGRGTGLGLATVYGIVRQSGGWIWVYSEVDRGATFKIYLPRTGGHIEAGEAEKIETGTLRGRETVLVVEDQDEVRELVSQVLKSYGYRVLAAANGGEALLLAEGHPGPIHLMLTDVVMPRMTGKQLAERVAPLRPDMKVLYTSGYTDNVIAHRGILDSGVACLTKPFTPAALAAKVREVLGATTGMKDS